MHARKDRPPLRRSTEIALTTYFAARFALDACRYDRTGTDGVPLRFEYAEFADLTGRAVAAISAFTAPVEHGEVEGFHALFDLPLN